MRLKFSTPISKIVLLLMLLCPVEAWAQMALRSGSFASTTASAFSTGAATCTLGATAQTGDVVVVGFGLAASNRTVSSAVDNNTNALTEVFFHANAGASTTSSAYFIYVASGTVTSATITLSGTAAPSIIWCAAFTNSATSSQLGSIVETDVGSGTTHTSSNVTTTVANAMIVAGFTGDNNRTVVTPDPDYTTALNHNEAFFTYVSGYRLLTATETNNFTVEMSATTNSAIGIGVLNGTTGGGGGGTTARMLTQGVGQQ